MTPDSRTPGGPLNPNPHTTLNVLILVCRGLSIIYTVTLVVKMQRPSPMATGRVNVLLFWSSCRLSEDAVARNQTLLTQQLSWLPRRTLKEVCKRLAFFSSQRPAAPTRPPGPPSQQPGANTRQLEATA